MRRFGLSEANGLILAAYLVPSWATAAGRIIIHPVQGLFDRANLSVALYASDHLMLTPSGLLRFAWMLALAKIVAVAFFAAFAAFALRGQAARASARELLGFALALSGLIAFAALFLAAGTGEAGLIRLHAAEAILIIGALVVMLVEGGLPPRKLGTPGGASDLAGRAA